MKQLIQDISSGTLTVAEVPAPQRPRGWLLVATRASLISAGTERTLMELGEASLVGKARARPDLVRKVIDSARSEGIASTYAKVRGRLDEPTALGYSLCGTVLEADAEGGIAPGDLVACAGAGYASHAEVVAVPPHLCARVPDGVGPEEAAYATVAAIALHGFRLLGAALGEVVAVVGLGLVGQLTLDLVAAAGCVPVGIDPAPDRVALARDAGHIATGDAAEHDAEVRRLTEGRGADGVLVTAASKSAAPLDTAIAVAGERAVISVVGDVGIEASRAKLFAKELRLVVSRSYGPGRYDPEYEEGGHDYPAGYVRWTEGRNLQEVLRLMSSGDLSPRRLTTHRFPLERGPDAYALLKSEEASLGIVLTYPGLSDAGTRAVSLEGTRPRLRRPARRGTLRLGVIGAGAFARTVLLPQAARHAEIVAVATATGVSARSTAKRYGAGLATTEPERVLTAPDVDAVLIATRHDTHAEYATAALDAGKHVFVEKPLALDEDELRRVEDAASASDGILMVGFNRRFAPMMRQLRDVLGSRGPLVVTYRVNAGRLPRSHWTHDRAVGGGRIVGEGCHFVDAAAYLTGAEPRLVSAIGAGDSSEPLEDVAAATFAFGDGSIAQIVYSALGDPRLPKERVEVLGEHGAAVLDDYSSLVTHRGGRTTSERGSRDKGHRAELEAFADACRSGRQPWPVSDMAAVMRATFAMRDAVERQPSLLPE